MPGKLKQKAQDLSTNVEKYKNYFYEFEILLVLEGQTEPIPLTNNCTRVQIENEYDDLQFPVVEMDFKLVKKTYHLLQSNYNKAFINMKTYKKQSIAKGKYDARQVCIEPVQFMILGLDNHQPSPEELTYNESDDDNFTSPGRTYEVTVHLIDKDHVAMHRGIINNVFNDITMLDLFKHIVSKYSKKKLLIKTPDHNEEYENILIPPMNVSKAIYYIQRIYGCYNAGVRYFQDFKFTWLMGKDQTIQKPGNHYEKVLIECVDPVQNDIIMVNSTFNDQNQRTHFVRTVEQPIINYNDTQIRDLNGDQIVVDNTQHTSDQLPYNGTATGNMNNNIGVSKDRRIWNNFQHSNNVKEFLREQNEKLLDIKVKLPDADFENFQLDKTVHIIQTAKNYRSFQHTCRIKSHYVIFQKTDGETNWLAKSHLHLVPK